MKNLQQQWKKYRDKHYLYQNESDEVPDWFKDMIDKLKRGTIDKIDTKSRLGKR